MKFILGDIVENRNLNLPPSFSRIALPIAEMQTPNCLPFSAIKIPYSRLEIEENLARSREIPRSYPPQPQGAYFPLRPPLSRIFSSTGRI